MARPKWREGEHRYVLDLVGVIADTDASRQRKPAAPFFAAAFNHSARHFLNLCGDVLLAFFIPPLVRKFPPRSLSKAEAMHLKIITDNSKTGSCTVRRLQLDHR